MGPKPKNLLGRRFGKLTVIAPAPRKSNRSTWFVKCDCGSEVIKAVSAHQLIRGSTKSCGCLVGSNVRTHGASSPTSPKHLEYLSWIAMISRCYVKTNTSYPRYGAKGIGVCQEWRDSFESFYEDMGPKPTKKHTLGRVKNHIGYQKDNCRWETALEQGGNTSRNVRLNHNGMIMTISEWCRYLGVGKNTIRRRLKRGLTLEQALVGVK